jgi:uncharacterized protein (TIGR02271 family)
MTNQPSNSGPEPTASGSPHNDELLNRKTTEEMTIPVIEEQVLVEKQVVESGTVRITKVVREQQVPVAIPLVQEEHDIQRVPINEYVETPPPPIRYEGDTMIIPVVQEVLVVQKRLLLVEELHVTKNLVHKQDTQQVTLRKEEVIVEHIAASQTDDQAV